MLTDSPPPGFSVVLTTFNRARLVARSIASVLAQRNPDLELIVVDDGSTDGTADVVSSFVDRRMRYIRQANGGLSRARNAGISAARGEWVVFLDDDDEAHPWWLEEFAAQAGENVGVVCCAAEFRDRVVEPKNLGPLFEDQTGLFLAGSFCVRRRILNELGGYLPELRCSHQTELALRLVPHCVERSWTIASTRRPGVRISHRQAAERPIRNPEALLESSLLIAARHEERFRRDPRAHGLYLGIAGVSAARLGRYALARQMFRKAMRRHPTGWRSLLRLAIAHVPFVARRVWGRRERSPVPGDPASWV